MSLIALLFILACSPATHKKFSSSSRSSTFIFKKSDFLGEQPLLFRIPPYRTRNYQSKMMKTVVAFFAAVAILCCTADDSVTTSLLVPDGLFATEQSFEKPTFVGQVTVTRSTTLYTLDCDAGGAGTYFHPGDSGCTDNSYAFSEVSASTQYLYEE